MPRKRAAPELFDDEPAFGRGLMGALGRLVSNHPSVAGGSVAFSVIFAFVAANALWSQPGRHPAPILKTRGVETAMNQAIKPAVRPAIPATPQAMAPFTQDVAPRTVRTFRIERSDDTSTASIPVPNAKPVEVSPSGPRQTAQPQRAVQTPNPQPQAAKADPVLVKMQQILARNGLYSGDIDGLMGPKSAAAIRSWEKNNGYVQTGKATPGLLAVMERATDALSSKPMQSVSLERGARAVPKPRPVNAPSVAVDRRAGEPVTVPVPVAQPKAAPAAPSQTAQPSSVDQVLASELVRQIQSGLSNIAYADIAVDGVAGSQTKAAISAFEKHYRLPVTGQPNRAVLEKLIEIGAL